MKIASARRARSVLISGATGFIGSHVTNHLTARGFQVIGFARHGMRTKEFIPGDICDTRFVHVLFRQYRPDVYVHFSGCGTYESMQRDTREAKRVTTEGARVVLEACRKYRPKRIIFGSTSQVYGGSSQLLSEQSPLKAKGPFETLKRSVDLLAQSYAAQYHLPIIISRFVNVYGPGDANVSRIVPAIIRQTLLERGVRLWGNGNIIREYLYIDDAVDAIDKMITQSLPSSPLPIIFNIGSGDPITIKKLVRTIIELSGKKIHTTYLSATMRDIPGSVILSSAKAATLLHWRPAHTISEGLTHTIPWYTKFFQRPRGV